MVKILLNPRSIACFFLLSFSLSFPSSSSSSFSYSRKDNLDASINEVSNSPIYKYGRIFSIQPNQFALFSAPVQLREISKEGPERRPNDANNDSAEGDLPVFEPTAANVSAFVGQTVYLPCRVRNLGDKVVSRSNFLPKRN